MIFVIEPFYLVLSLLICFGWNMFFYFIAAGCKFDKVTDLAYGTNFIVVVVVTLMLNETFFIRQIVMTAMVGIWGMRLALYLFIRILVIGEDKRFDEFRNYPLRFLRFWVFQLITVWVVLLPEIILNSKHDDPPISWLDYLGWSLFAIGFIFEAVADHQKFLYRLKSSHNNHWCDVGLWHYSRHPNYFGEILLWYGLYIAACPTFVGSEFATVLGPTYLALVIMFISGVSRLEESADKRYYDNEDYRQYKHRTPILIPFCPGVCTGPMKVLCCCEFSFFSSSLDKREQHEIFHP